MPQPNSEPQMLIATHKQVPLPNDDFYSPIVVGHTFNKLETEYLRDDTGENISSLNKSYCELTALYWAWKNLEGCDYIGLSHYRRYFVGDVVGPNGKGILSKLQAVELMDSHEFVLSKPRNYYVETIDSHYRNGHVGSDLDVLRSVIQTQSVSLIPAYDEVFGGKKLSLYNMFLTSWPEFCKYCEWLFPILAEVSQHIDNDSRDDYQKRTYGYLGERLLNVWVKGNFEDHQVGYRKVVNTDGEPKISKGIGMLKRKLRPAAESAS